MFGLCCTSLAPTASASSNFTTYINLVMSDSLPCFNVLRILHTSMRFDRCYSLSGTDIVKLNSKPCQLLFLLFDSSLFSLMWVGLNMAHLPAVCAHFVALSLVLQLAIRKHCLVLLSFGQLLIANKNFFSGILM